MSITTIPPEVFSDILVYLDNANYELLYRTGCKRIISLLCRSVKRIDKVKKMHIGFRAVESISTINGEDFDLFPKLKQVGSFRPIEDDELLLIPSTVTTILITKSYPLKTYSFTPKSIDILPATIMNLSIDEFMVDDVYVFREGYSNIIINRILSTNRNNVVIFPTSATHIGYNYSDCGVILSPDIEVLKTPIFISGIYSKLKRLTCGRLLHTQDLPPTIEYLWIRDFRIDDLYTQARDIMRIYSNIFSLSRLTELSMPLPYTVVNLLPKNIKKLTVDLKYNPIIAYWEKHIKMHDLSITDLTIDQGTILSITLPVTLTKLSCEFLYIEHIKCILPNLKYLRINTSNTKITTYDFSIYEHLTELHTTRSVLLSKLPKSLLRLTCNSVLHESDDYPLYLSSLHMQVSYGSYVSYLKSIMKYCDIKTDKLLESPEKRLKDLFENNPVPHITNDKYIMRKLEIKIYWCDMTCPYMISEILRSIVTEKSINLAISTYLSDKELSYIARNM